MKSNYDNPKQYEHISDHTIMEVEIYRALNNQIELDITFINNKDGQVLSSTLLFGPEVEALSKFLQDYKDNNKNE